MGDYTKLSLEEAKNILQLYNLGEVQSLTPMSHGTSNSNYRVDSPQGSFLLKVSNDKGPKELQEEVYILKVLDDLSFPYSLKPIATTKEDEVYFYNDYIGALFPFIEGAPPDPSAKVCYQIGHALAELHQLKIDKKIRSYKGVGQNAEEIAIFVTQPNCPEDFLQAYQQLFPEGLNHFLEHDWPLSLIHGDLYIDNTLFQNEKLVNILDFEQSGFGRPILDLGISLSGTCLINGDINLDLVKNFLEGYESVKPLGHDEIDFLIPSIYLGLLSIAYWRIIRFQTKELDFDRIHSYKELLSRATDLLQSLKETHS
jgi:homoserine kinase type II